MDNVIKSCLNCDEEFDLPESVTNCPICGEALEDEE